MHRNCVIKVKGVVGAGMGGVGGVVVCAPGPGVDGIYMEEDVDNLNAS